MKSTNVHRKIGMKLFFNRKNSVILQSSSIVNKIDIERKISTIEK